MRGNAKKWAKSRAGIVDYDEVLPAFREVDVGGGAGSGRPETDGDQNGVHGSSALAGFGSAKCSNEEAYLFQKLIRAGFGTNNVDHCTRLCHASSVAALLETIGSGAVTNVFADVARAEVCLVTGTHTQPPTIRSQRRSSRRRPANDTKADCGGRSASRTGRLSRRTSRRSVRGATCRFTTRVMHVLISEDLIDQEFIAARTEGFEHLRELVLDETFLQNRLRCYAAFRS